MLFYTGANKSNAIQTNSARSLGGWISSSQIPNEVLNNIFGNIDYTIVSKNLKSNRVIAFKNTTGSIIPTFKIWTISPLDSFAKFKIGIILNSIEPSCNFPYFEQLSSEAASPMYVSLAECEAEVNALTLSNIPIDQYVGIFIQRELIEANNPDFGGASKTCEQFYEDFITPPTISEKTEDLIEIVISY